MHNDNRDEEIYLVTLCHNIIAIYHFNKDTLVPNRSGLDRKFVGYDQAEMMFCRNDDEAN